MVTVVYAPAIGLESSRVAQERSNVKTLSLFAHTIPWSTLRLPAVEYPVFNSGSGASALIHECYPACEHSTEYNTTIYNTARFQRHICDEP